MFNTDNLPTASDIGRESLVLGLEKTIEDDPGDSAPHIFTIDKQGNLIVSFELAHGDWKTIRNAIGAAHSETKRHNGNPPSTVRDLEAYEDVYETIDSEVPNPPSESGWITISFTMNELNRLFDVTSEAELEERPFASTSTFTRLKSLISHAANARAQIIGRAALLASDSAAKDSTGQERPTSEETLVPQ